MITLPKQRLMSSLEGPSGVCSNCGTLSRQSSFKERMLPQADAQATLALQKFQDSDMVFFPVPSSEAVAICGKTRKVSFESAIKMDTTRDLSESHRSNDQRMQQPAFGHSNGRGQSPSYRTISPSTEVAKTWIAMGACGCQQNCQTQGILLSEVPFDEEDPPASVESVQFQKEYPRPPTAPRGTPLVSTTVVTLSETPCSGIRLIATCDNTKIMMSSCVTPNFNRVSRRMSSETLNANWSPDLGSSLLPIISHNNDPNDDSPSLSEALSSPKPGFFQRLKFPPKSTYRSDLLSEGAKKGFINRGRKSLCVSDNSRGARARSFWLPQPFTIESLNRKRISMSKEGSKSNQDSSVVGNTKKTHWKSAVDPRTGRTYYYHEITRETQWRKPMELATDEEKRAMEEKERKQKDFFAAMEANIMNSISQGVIPGTPVLRGDSRGASSSVSFGRRISSRKVSLGPDARPELVRTISTMDENILMDVIRRQPSFRNLAPGLSREESLQPNDLLAFRRRTSEVRDGFENWSQGSLSQNQPLETLEERLNESTDSLPALFGLLADGNGNFESAGDESFSHLQDGDRMNESSLTGFGLTWEETQALKKLASITKEMIDAEKDVLVFEDSPTSKSNKKIGPAGATPSWKPKDDKEKRDLPRELDFDESDDEDEHKEPLKQLPALTKARQGSDGRALPREIDFSSDEEEDSEYSPTPKGPKPNPSPSSDRSERENSNARPEIKRRNTCGTMYIGTTMSAPDKDATIRVVCGVVRSHILSSEQDTRYNSETDPYKVFNDQESEQGGRSSDLSSITKTNPPSLDEVATFYRDIFFKAQMEADCIIMSLIYVERLIKKTAGLLRPRAGNWRSLLFSCMILSSKVWDDLSMWNVDFSQSCPPGVSFSLQRINELELAVLNALSFKVKVPASEYAKYYFLLRSMLIKSGLAGDDLSALNPLDVQGARKLQQVSSQFESLSLTQGDPLGPNQRSKSMDPRSIQKAALAYSSNPKLGLEQVVKM